MKQNVLRILLCIFFFGFTLASYVEKQNQLTALKLKIPEVAKEIKAIREENTRLRYEIDQFESPENLLELAKGKEFSHLKHPFVSDILTLKEGIALELEPVQEEIVVSPAAKVSIAIGTR